MNLPVNYIDQKGNIKNINFNISRLALIKHLAIAGQRYSPKLFKIIRLLGMALHYHFYLQRESLNNNHLSEPPIELSDPTEKGQFSTLIGKAIADYLSKRIYNSLITVNYEAAMRILKIPISGKRPDLISFSSNSIFAIESKGYSIKSVNMNQHKAQALSGPIPVDFAIACVSYNLYNDIKCNYHDPNYDDISKNQKLLIGISRNYYSGLLEFVNEKYFEINEITFNNEDFYEISLDYRRLERLFFDLDVFPLIPKLFELFEIYKPSILITKQIYQFSKVGLSLEKKLFKFIQEKNIYIDNDRIGIKIRYL